MRSKIHGIPKKLFPCDNIFHIEHTFTSFSFYIINKVVDQLHIAMSFDDERHSFKQNIEQRL